MFFAIDTSWGLPGKYTCGYGWCDVYEVSQLWYQTVNDSPLPSMDVVYVGF